MPTVPSVQKAKLTVVDRPNDSLACWFNPSTLVFERVAKWEPRPAAGQGAPDLAYTGGKAETLTLDLLLHAQFGKTGADVQKDISWLFSLLDPTVMVPSARAKRPPIVQFSWGQYVSFDAVCLRVNVNEKLFDVNGTPIRAEVTLELKQEKPEPGQATPAGQNPTTRAVLANHSHTLRPGDSLAAVAYKHYGDPNRWREIAAANDIDDPLRLIPGTAVVVRMSHP